MFNETSEFGTQLQRAVQVADEQRLDAIFPGGRWSVGKCLAGIVIPVTGNFQKIRIEPDVDEASSLSFSKVIFAGRVDGMGEQQNIGEYTTCTQSSFYKHKKDPRGAIDSPVFEMGIHTNKEDNPWWQADFDPTVKLKTIFLHLRADSYAHQNKDLRVYGIEEGGREQLIFRSAKGDCFRQSLSDGLLTALDAAIGLGTDVSETDLPVYEKNMQSVFGALVSELTSEGDGATGIDKAKRQSMAAQLLAAIELGSGGAKDFGMTAEDGYSCKFKPVEARYLRVRAFGAYPTSFGGIQLLSEQNPEAPVAYFKGKETQLRYQVGPFIRPEYFAAGLHGDAHSRVMDLGQMETFDALRIWNINRQQAANSTILEFCVSDDRKNWRTVHDKGIGYKYVSVLLALVDYLVPTAWMPEYARLRGKLYTQYRRGVMVAPVARITRKNKELLKAVFEGSEEIFKKKQHAVPLRMGKHGLRVPLAFRNEKKTMEHLVKVRDDIRALGHKPLFMYGTLLGAIREKDFIPHDDDIDLAIILENIHPDDLIKEADKMLVTLNDAGIKTTRGPAGAPLLHCQRPPLTIDIFVFSHFEDKIYWLHKGLAVVAERADIFLPIQTIEFKGETFDAPFDPEAVSEARYGADWRIPNAAFEW